MRNMAVLHSPAFSYPLPVLVRVLFNLLIFKGKILYYNKYTKMRANHNWYEPIAQTEDAVSNGSKILNLNKTLSDFPTILYLYTLFFIHEY